MKASQIRDSYADCLPKQPHATFGNIFVGVTGCASLISLLIVLKSPSPSTSETIFSIFLVLLTLSCLAYTAFQAHKRLHHYAEVVFFYHYVNHTLRDYTAQVAFNEEPDRNLHDLLADILTAIATCFSIVTGKQCRCCIKEITNPLQQNIITVMRDKISAAQGESLLLDSDIKVTHTLENNTDFYNLWYAEGVCKRVYLATNLWKEYKYGRYKNSSFEVLGEPQTFSLGRYKFLKTWTLPYRSTLVLPIRYIAEFNPPCKDINRPGNNQHWKFWGFLCVDCNSRNVFDYRYATELGGAFADLLYSLFIELDLATAVQSDKIRNNNEKTLGTKDSRSKKG